MHLTPGIPLDKNHMLNCIYLHAIHARVTEYIYSCLPVHLFSHARLSASNRMIRGGSFLLIKILPSVFLPLQAALRSLLIAVGYCIDSNTLPRSRLQRALGYYRKNAASDRASSQRLMQKALYSHPA